MLEKYNKDERTYPAEVFQQYTPERGNWAGQSMFLEFPQHGKNAYPTLWTTKGHEVQGHPSAYEVYMDSIDEFDAGIKLAGSILNWKVISREDSWFYKEHLCEWREHMAMRDASLAKQKIIENTKAGQTTAANSLKTWDKEIKKAGRKMKPSNKAESDHLALVKSFKPKQR